jgi:DNA-binding GntR family transcriptional regulator
MSLPVSERLRHDIIAGSFPFGGRLKIDDLASRYATSHMPIREALRQLHGEGLIDFEPNKGARVRAVDADFVRDLFDLRIALEAMLTRRAAQRITSAQLEDLERTEAELEAQAAQGDYAGVLRANRRFHATINDAAGNVEANRVIDSHWNIIVGLWQRHGYGPERVAGVISDHQQLLYSLSQRDSEGAAILATAHAAKARNEILKRMDAARP